MGDRTPVTLAGLFQKLANERALELTDADAIYGCGSSSCGSGLAAQITALKSAIDGVPQQTESLVAASLQTIANDVILERVNAIPGDTQQLLSGSLEAQNGAVINKIADVNASVATVKTEVAKIPGLISGLSASIDTKLEGVKQGVDVSITQLNTVVTSVETQLGQSMQKLNNDLAVSTDNVRLAVIDSMKAMDAGINQSLAQLKEGTEAQIKVLNSSMTQSIGQVQSLIDNPNDGLVVKLKTANATIDACSTRLSKMVSDIEQSDSIKDIRTKVSSYYDCYGQLLSHLVLLERQCVTNYALWMDEAEKAASRQLDVADTLEQVTIRMAVLNEHESKLEYIIGQFDKMVHLSDEIGALSALWESDHDVIQQFNEIVKSQKTFNATLAAAQIGTALSGAAAAATAIKDLTTKPTPREVV